MNVGTITELERRYQTLIGDFRAGKIDETTFVSRVDSLQFQDEWGRYWMMGAQTGAWHYYDGQTWHQADPRDADKLPFLDDQGRYWQQGARSGDWYYYEADSGEWVKPDRNDPSIPRFSQGGVEKPDAAPYQSHLHPQSASSGPDMPSQLDGELFQDDEGRYWMVGAKTGQWYFYDYDGWHSAQEFQYRTQSAQPYAYQPQSYQYEPPAYSYYPQTPYPTQPQGYAPQGYAAQSQQAQFYTQAQQAAPQAPTAPPAQDALAQAAQPQPAQTQSAPAPTEAKSETTAKSAPARLDVSEIPNPPSEKSDSGSWYYFDGKQWLKYSSGEPADDVPPPNPEMILEQKAEPAQAKARKKEETARVETVVVAELFEDDDEEPPVEIVDVEVITVIEAEPDRELAAAPAPEAVSVSSASTAPPDTEDIPPRRSTRPVEQSASVSPSTPVEPRRQPRERTSTEPGRPITPRKPETAHEPTIIIPTESAASSIGAARTARPATRPVPAQPRPQPQPEVRRARESTMPMETVTAAAGAHSPHQATRPIPQQTQLPRSDTDKIRIARAREDTKPDVAVTPKPAAPATAKPPKTGYTFGDVLRAFPSTFWTLAIGITVLIIFMVIIGIGSWMLQNNSLGVGSLAVGQSPTPTLGVAIADSTPTPGPTPEVTPEPLAPSVPSATIPFSSSALGFSLEYPEEWYREEGDLQVGFSPSQDGLDPDNLNSAAMWVGQSANKTATITEILTELLAQFPPEAETLNQGTISIASQTWTSAQIGFEDPNLGGQGIATLAVTSKDGAGYYLVAVAPANQWNSVQPIFQGMINSFNFTAAETVAQASPTAPSDTTPAPEATEEPTPEPDTPAVEAAPVTYIVQSGDTLLGIAVQFDVDVDLLAAKNGIENPNDLRVGQELIIPFTDEELADYTAATGTAGTGAAAAEVSTEEATESAETPANVEAPPAEPAEPSEQAPAAAVGGRIVYPAFNPAINSYDIWLVDVGSGNQSVIANNASQPAFSKDGGLLVYRSWSLDSRGIFFRDFIGGRGGQVTRFVEDGLPTWSPDNFTFSFASRREGDRVPRIYRGDQLGQTDYPIGFQGEYPSTFPDGRLMVKGCLPNGDCGLYIIGPNGGGERKISGEGGDTAPAVSPDGSKIAFMSSARGATNWEIWVMNADGSNPQRLTENGSNDGLPAWSPDGQSIAFVSDQGGVWAVWVMNADGSNQRKLFNMNGSPDGIVLHAGNDSRGWLEERISWAP
ncbi:MAG: PD40 domain-containing protein [Anaerolineae bacterium]|nr:PD40 domain-containing protein [Anaerolineae bacterium]